ncbi:MAG: OmpA family protein, partial [Hyphomicrobiaceae bacterium]
ERVVLTGYVPNEPTRNAILSSIKGHLPIVTVEDRMQLGEGELAFADWRTGVAFALARLADLRYGEARLRDLTLSLSGQARDAASHVALKQAISTDLPPGLALAKVSITPPTFNPYRWSARSTDTDVTLAGHVPHDGARGQIVAQTERLFPGRSIQDRMVLGAGAPNLSIWHRGVRFALEHLAKLKDGETTLTNLALNVTGRAVDASSLQAVKSALANSLPEGVTLSGATIAPPLVSPFKWSAFIAGRKVVLSGHVPSAQARATLLKTAAIRFKDKTVLDRMSPAAGLPGPLSDWVIATEAGLSALAELSNGQVTLIDAEMAVEGLAETPRIAKQIAVGIEAVLPKGYRLNHRIAAKRQPEPNVVWRATINNDRIVLSGEVPGAQARTTLLASARLQNKGLVVEDQMRVVDGASQRWQVTAVAALRMLSKLASGRAELSGQRLRIVGETDNPTLAERVRKFLRSGLPEGYQGDDVVTVRALAPTASGRRAERVGDAAPEPGMTADPSGSLDAVESPNPARHSVDGVNETVRQKTARISPSEVAAVLATNKRVEPGTCQVLLDTTVRNGRINFPRRSARILPESLPTLVRLSSIAKRCPNTRIKISGHTDSDGDDRFNQSLSERRARSIVGYLVDKGIENARLQAVGFGEKQPLVPNTSSKNKARNRRIEFSIKMP